MSPLRCCLLWCCLTALTAVDVNTMQSEDPAVLQLRRQREQASRYLVERASFVAPAGYHAAAANALDAAGRALEEDRFKDAWKISNKAYKAYPFSRSADDLLHVYVIAAIERGEVSRAARSLIDLWYRFPGHDGLDALLAVTMNKAEELQNPNDAIDWSADEPSEVIDRSAVDGLLEADMFFRFLADHGDYHEIAPRATLGLARSILIGGYTSPARLAEARIAYMDLLQRYPESDLIFDALCEYTLCHLLGFRGDRYDGGVLDTASLFIDQAELYTENRPERNELIDRYRALITRWSQRKDYQVARWYDDKGHERSALYYYRSAVAYDRTSPTARTALRAIARLEPQVEQAPEPAADDMRADTSESP